MKKLVQLLILVMIPFVSFSQTARVQVVHNSADAAAAEVDVYLNSTLLLDNVPFRTASPFIDAPAGIEINLSIAPANSTGVGDALLTVPVTLAENETYIVVADGIASASGYNPAPPLSLQVYPMARETANNSSNVDVLVHHGSTDAPTVDVAEILLVGSTLVDDISYSEFQGYLEIPTADYILEVRTGDGNTKVAAYSAPLATLGLDGAAITVFASGFLDPSQNSNGPAFGLFVSTADGGPLLELPSASISAAVQIIHNSPDAAASVVDIYCDDDLVLDDFPFRTATPFLNFLSGVNIDFSVAPGNSTSVADALITVPVTLDENGLYIVVADGIVSASGYNPAPPLSLEIFATARNMATNSSNVDVLVHHGSTDAPTVDVVETGVGAGTIVDDISYSEFQGYLELPAADYTLEIRTADGNTGVAAYSAPLSTLSLDGSAITVLASGFLDPTQNSDGPAFGLYVAVPAGGPLLELPSATLGIENFYNEALALYPNPSNGILNISNSKLNLENYEIIITDMLGRRVYDSYLNSEGKINVNYLSNGIYNLSLNNGSDRVLNKKFVKN